MGLVLGNSDLMAVLMGILLACLIAYKVTWKAYMRYSPARFARMDTERKVLVMHHTVEVCMHENALARRIILSCVRSIERAIVHVHVDTAYHVRPSVGACVA